MTRAAEDAERWATRLASLGAEPVVLPCLVCEPIVDAAKALRLSLVDATWLVLSSRRGAESVAGLLDGALPPGVQVAVVGPTTARAAADELGWVDLVAADSTAAGLGRALCERLAETVPARVVIAGAAGGRRDVEAALAAVAAVVTRVDVYRTVPAPPTADKRDLATEGVDVVLLASPSAVVGLVNRAVLSGTAQIITIGPTTTAAAVAAGLTVAAEAHRPDLEGMLEALK